MTLMIRIDIIDGIREVMLMYHLSFCLFSMLSSLHTFVLPIKKMYILIFYLRDAKKPPSPEFIPIIIGTSDSCL